MGAWHALRDLLMAGFRVVRLEDPFIDQASEARDDWWLLVAVR